MPKRVKVPVVSLTDPEVRGKLLRAIEGRGGNTRKALEDLKIKEATFFSHRQRHEDFDLEVEKAVMRGKRFQKEQWWRMRSSVLDKLLYAVDKTDPDDLKLDTNQMIRLLSVLQEKVPQVQVNTQINQQGQASEKSMTFNLQDLSDEELKVIEKLHTTAKTLPVADAVDTGETPAVEYAEFETIQENNNNEQ